MSDSGEQERSDEEPFEESRVVSTGNDDPTKAENSFPRARKIPSRQIQLLSESLATDGGLIAIADVSEAMRDAGLELGYRVVGGIAVMLHVLRTGVDIPIRSTGDADYGVPPRVLTEGHLVKEIEKRGYTKTEGIAGSVESMMCGQPLLTSLSPRTRHARGPRGRSVK